MDEDFCPPELTPTAEVQRCIQQELGVLFPTLMDDGSFDYDFVQPNGYMGFSLFGVDRITVGHSKGRRTFNPHSAEINLT